MHHPIDTILIQLRQDLARHLGAESIHSACRAVGHFWRDCTLAPAAIVHWFVIQVLHGNTSLEHVAILAGSRFSGEAFCLARKALPLAVLQSVLRNVIAAMIPDTRTEGLWRGHRTWHVDGSAFSMPDTPALQNTFGQPSAQRPGCGFPVANILALFHAGTGLLIEVICTPLRSNAMASIDGIHPALKPNDVLIGDRGFCSFAHLAMLKTACVYAVFRMHQKQIVDFTPNRPHALPGRKTQVKGLPRSRWLRRLGVLDQVVEWFKPKDRPDWMSEETYATLPESLIVRELRYDVGGRGFRTQTVTLVTTLIDSYIYAFDVLAELYGTRWRVELNFRHLKTTMKMDILKCKTVDGVRKELTVYAIVYNLVRMVMIEAGRRQGVDVERVSFAAAMRWLVDANPGDDLPKLPLNPDRPGRAEPRVRKRRPKQYPLMKRPRSVLRKALLEKKVTA